MSRHTLRSVRQTSSGRLSTNAVWAALDLDARQRLSTRDARHLMSNALTMRRYVLFRIYGGPRPSRIIVASGRNRLHRSKSACKTRLRSEAVYAEYAE